MKTIGFPNDRGGVERRFWKHQTRLFFVVKTNRYSEIPGKLSQQSVLLSSQVKAIILRGLRERGSSAFLCIDINFVALVLVLPKCVSFSQFHLTSCGNPHFSYPVIRLFLRIDHRNVVSTFLSNREQLEMFSASRIKNLRNLVDTTYKER